LLSGYAALNYEMAWMRQLVSLFGVTYHAITTILVVFMGGIALGAVVAGWLTDRWRLPPLLVLAGLELLLAIFAQLFPMALDAVEGVYLHLASADISFAGHSAWRFLCAFLVLALPTLASGATLPVACKAFVRRKHDIGDDASLLYGFNVVGAGLGCLLTTFLTIGLWGFPATAWLGSAANLAAAALVLLLFWLSDARWEPPGAPAPTPAPAWNPAALPVAAAYFAVGACGVAGEVLWTRVLAQSTANPATLIFGLVLLIFLLGHALGAGLLYRLLAPRLGKRSLFVGLQLGIGLLVVVSVVFLIPAEPVNQQALLMFLGVRISAQRLFMLALGVFLPAMFSGALFPLASRLSIGGLSSLGRGIGSLGALSTLGGIAGSALTGFWLMPALGAPHCLLVMAGLCLLSAIWSAWALARRSTAAPATLLRALGMTAAVLGLVGGTLWQVKPYAHVQLTPGETLESFSEGRFSATAVVQLPNGDRRIVIHGEKASGGGSDIDLACRLHPAASKALVIGIGSGSVVTQAVRQSQLQEVVAVDPERELPSKIRLMGLPERNQALDSDKLRIVEDDGRHYLLTTDRSYDIIVNDAAYYAWYLELSTLEFTQLAWDALNPEGLYVGRLHMGLISEETLERELATFLKVFPNAAVWDPFQSDLVMLVGRKGELPLDGSATRRRPHPSKKIWLDAGQMADAAAGARIIDDDHPLHVPRSFVYRYYGPDERASAVHRRLD